MNARLFIQRRGVEFGPHTLAELRRLAIHGSLTSEDRFRVDGTEEWLPASQLDLEVPAALEESHQSAGQLLVPPAPPLPPPLPPPIPSVGPLRESPTSTASSELPVRAFAYWDKVERPHKTLQAISSFLRWLFPSPPQDPTLVEERTVTETLAATQRCLIWLVACYILACLIPWVLWGLIPLQLILQIRTMRLLGWLPSQIGWTTVGSLLPYFGCLFLLIINVNATRRLVAAGYEVGFWGAKANLAASATAGGPVLDSDSSQVRTWKIVLIPHVRTWDIIVIAGLWLWCLGLGLALATVGWGFYLKKQSPSGSMIIGATLLMVKSLELAWKRAVELKQRFSSQPRVPKAD